MSNLTEKRHRADVANQVLAAVARHGRRFFYTEKHNRVSRFEVDARGMIWYFDHYTDKRILPRLNHSWRGFSDGGTLRGVVEALTSYIRTGEPIQRGYFGPWPKWVCGDGDRWGYGAKAMEAVRREVMATGVVTKNHPLVVNVRNRRPGGDYLDCTYVGRPVPKLFRGSPFANPFKIGMDPFAAMRILEATPAPRTIVIEFTGPLDRAKAIECYRSWLLNQPELVELAKQHLRGKKLGCWCAPHACHADVLAEIANTAGPDPDVNPHWLDPEKERQAVQLLSLQEPPCWVCGKLKGQPPERCNGHYEVTPAPAKDVQP